MASVWKWEKSCCIVWKSETFDARDGRYVLESFEKSFQQHGFERSLCDHHILAAGKLRSIDSNKTQSVL